RLAPALGETPVDEELIGAAFGHGPGLAAAAPPKQAEQAAGRHSERAEGSPCAGRRENYAGDASAAARHKEGLLESQRGQIRSIERGPAVYPLLRWGPSPSPSYGQFRMVDAIRSRRMSASRCASRISSSISSRRAQ